MSKAPRIIDQSGVIPFRFHEGQLQVLLITSSDGLRWGVPKGLVEPDLTPAQSAAKEALEEAGIRGLVSPDAIGAYDYEKWGGLCRVKVFLMRVAELLPRWEEMHRTREWVSVAEAVERIKTRGLRQLLRELPGWINLLAPQ